MAQWLGKIKSMTEDLYKELGKMMSSIETNTTLTRDIANDVKEIRVKVSELDSTVKSHKKYLENLDERLVEERKHREDIKEEISFFKGGVKLAVALWSVISSIIVGFVTHFLTK